MIGACLALFLAASASAEEVLVSAAASLKDVLEAAAPAFEKREPGVQLVFNLGASGQLRMQVENGAPVDAFLSAGVSDMDALERKGLLLPGTRADVAGNALVLIRSRARPPRVWRVDDLALKGVSRVAMVNPVTSPAGRYARQALEKRGLYDKLKGKLIFAENVRQVLDYVARDEADAGFVYKTDALIEPKAELVETVPPDAHEPILYPAAALKTGKNPDGAKKFVEYLRSKQGAALFRRHGFR
ncbi:MAG TPA: molybdate ABC transporter substrate-binding protein [Elusimicrobia bacterium]|nr:molybdate ABC transporter substrate-binding protein [Elusimicrobiota bacterium]